MAESTVLYNIRKNKNQVIELDPRHAEPVDSNRRQMLVLELSSLLSRSLEIENIIDIFSTEVRRYIFHSGCRYEYDAMKILFSKGDSSGHSANYQLSIHDQQLGELTLFRDSGFSSEEICELEELLCALIFPIKHAVMYQMALKSAYSDSLTELNNRTAMKQYLPREIELSKRHHQPMAVLVMDLDGFKQINDNYGHDTGDQVLCEVGQVILNGVRNTDLLYRYGGDEFIAGLVQTDFEGALDVSERIRLGVETLAVNSGLPVEGIKISIGLTMVESDDCFKSVFKRADKALYEAKMSGKNRIAVG